MRTPWQQAFYEEYGVEYDSDFEQGGGPYNPGCSHPWERSSSTSSSGMDCVFDYRDHTTPPSSPRRVTLPDNPPRRRVIDIDRSDISPQLMARHLRNRRGNSTTPSGFSSVHGLPRNTTTAHANCVAPAPSKAPPMRQAAKPHLTGKQYVQSLRDRRSAARNRSKAHLKPRQRAPKAPKACRSRNSTKPPVEGKWVFIPTPRDLTRSEPCRLALDETAPPSYLAAQTAAVMIFMFFIAILSVYTLK